MKKSIIGFFMVVLLIASPVIQAETLTFALKVDSNSTVFKLSQKVLTEVAAIVGDGLEIKLIDLPLDRAIIYLKEGKISGDYVRMPGLYTDAPNVIMMPYPIAKLNLYAFSKKDIPITGWDSFSKHKVIYQRGQQVVEKGLAGRALSIHPVNSIESGLKMLAADRGDVWMGFDISTIPYCIALKCKENGIKMLEPSLKTIPLFLYLNKAHEKYSQPLAKAFKQIIESGRSADIMAGKE
ncbi:transporter substrate-binding domain-containing protein [bacterium]|nr:transporter substrate-binding domain-containing protein [bacterium]